MTPRRRAYFRLTLELGFDPRINANNHSRRFPLLAKEAARFFSPPYQGGARGGCRLYCFMDHRGSETQRRIERNKEKAGRKLRLIFSAPLCQNTEADNSLFKRGRIFSESFFTTAGIIHEGNAHTRPDINDHWSLKSTLVFSLPPARPSRRGRR